MQQSQRPNPTQPFQARPARQARTHLAHKPPASPSLPIRLCMPQNANPSRPNKPPIFQPLTSPRNSLPPSRKTSHPKPRHPQPLPPLPSKTPRHARIPSASNPRTLQTKYPSPIYHTLLPPPLPKPNPTTAAPTLP
eukprot:GFKZ01013497.1.p1 GENE.GFKZ01013497.1~~GFKZ01013497.1.p1  ORF type:complete len:136 (+),score=7.49 GFKZ01013497.1:574-981(+)